MLLGYATGELPAAGDYAGIDPYPEIAGLSAGLAGALDDLLRVLTDWWRDALAPRAPDAWASRLRKLVESLFQPGDDTERTVLAALDDGNTQLLLQLADAARQRGLRDVAGLRRAGEVLFTRERCEILELADIHD